MPLDPSIILKNLTPGDVQAQRATIDATNTQTQTNQLLQPYQVQAAGLQNQQTAAMNPLAVQNAKYQNAVSAMTIAAQVSSGIHDQPSLDAAHKTLQGVGLDSQAQLPTTWDPVNGPAQAAQAYQTALQLKGQYLDAIKANTEVQNANTNTQHMSNDARNMGMNPDGSPISAAPTIAAPPPTPNTGTLSNPVPAPPSAGQMQSQLDGNTSPSPTPVQSSNLPPPAGQGSMNMPASVASSPAMQALANSGSALPQPDQPNVSPAYSAAVGAQPAGAVAAQSPSAATPLQGQSASVAPAPAQQADVVSRIQQVNQKMQDLGNSPASTGVKDANMKVLQGQLDALNKEADISGVTDQAKAGVVMQGQINDQADQALATKRIAMEMQQLSSGLQTGNLAPLKAKVGAWAVSLGADPDKIATQLGNVGDAQAMGKLTAQLATQALKTFTSRGTQMEFHTMLMNNPNLAMTPQGFNTVLDFISKSADVPLQKQQAFSAWKQHQSPQNYQDFSNVWNQQLSKNMQSTLTSPSSASAPPITATNSMGHKVVLRGRQWQPM